ncbi:MAG: CHASE2 domain-containing protein [Gemmatimonadaceae bacterium]|nr:CHASE2 domain-containing protein [Gemmatimonadaceae bacterium]
MIDTPPARERFLDARRLAIFGGVLTALTGLAVAAFLQIDSALDRATDDRVATALADTPIMPRLIVVRVPSRTGDWKIATAVVRMDSAGARAVGVAIDLSVPVAPTGTLPDLLPASPHAVIGVALGGDSIAWPWFLADSLRVRGGTAARIGYTELLRDPDGVVRQSRRAATGESWLSDRMAAVLSGRPITTGGNLSMRLRFARPDTAWYGACALSIDSVLTLAPEALHRIVADATVLLGIDDSRSVPTSVGAMPPLAVLAHETNARARIALDDVAPLQDATWWVNGLWLLAAAVLGACIAALTSLRSSIVLAGVALVAQVAIVLWLIDASGLWLPLGTAILALMLGMLGAEAVELWQARRRQRLTTLLFSRFVTPALAAEAWSARHLYLQGGRPAPLQLPVTVLFVDLRGFTRYSEATPARDVMQLLTDVTAACAADIAAHGGLVDDFAGDGIKADFGVPVPRTDAATISRDAINAVQCAQSLAASIERLLPASLGTNGTQARIGVHSGTAAAGTIGGTTRLKYTVVGDVVNVAARLQSVDIADDATVTTRCRIVVSADTMALMGASAPPATDLGALPLSGRAHTVHAFRLHAVQASSH